MLSFTPPLLITWCQKKRKRGLVMSSSSYLSRLGHQIVEIVEIVEEGKIIPHPTIAKNGGYKKFSNVF